MGTRSQSVLKPFFMFDLLFCSADMCTVLRHCQTTAVETLHRGLLSFSFRAKGKMLLLLRTELTFVRALYSVWKTLKTHKHKTQTWFCSFLTESALPLLISDWGLGTWSKPHGEPWPDPGWLWTGKKHTNKQTCNNWWAFSYDVLFWEKNILTGTRRDFLIFAAGRIRLFFGGNRLVRLVCIRHNMKSRGLRHMKGEKIEIKRQVTSTMKHNLSKPFITLWCKNKWRSCKHTPPRWEGAMTTPALGTTSAFKGVGVTITALVWPGKGAEKMNTDIVSMCIYMRVSMNLLHRSSSSVAFPIHA